MVIVIPASIIPNFFIIGAPKCGTTALYHWLSRHPNVFLCKPKEPNFFSSDIQTFRAANSLAEYNRLFEKARNLKDCFAIGEASSVYLRSSVAVPSILKLCPHAKFIVGLRNPYELAVAMHAELVKSGQEPIFDFRKAWNLQSSRRLGRNLPRFALSSSVFLYYETALLGSQVEALMSICPRSQIYFYFLEEIVRNPQEEYRKIFSFLEIPYFDLGILPVKNSRKIYKSSVGFHIQRLLSLSKIYLSRAGIKLHSTGVGDFVVNLFSRSLLSKEKLLSPDILDVMDKCFNDEISKLEVLLNKDLSHWYPSI